MHYKLSRTQEVILQVDDDTNQDALFDKLIELGEGSDEWETDGDSYEYERHDVELEGGMVYTVTITSQDRIHRMLLAGNLKAATKLAMSACREIDRDAAWTIIDNAYVNERTGHKVTVKQQSVIT